MGMPASALEATYGVSEEKSMNRSSTAKSKADCWAGPKHWHGEVVTHHIEHALCLRWLAIYNSDFSASFFASSTWRVQTLPSVSTIVPSSLMLPPTVLPGMSQATERPL